MSTIPGIPRGAPWVLAFARDWAPHAAADGPVRAQLRGLGAVMIVVCERGVWCFRPDDDLVQFASPGPQLAGEVAALAARHGVAPDEDAVFVFDGAGEMRLARTKLERLGASLADALDAAGRELIRGAPRHQLSRRDWAVTCLIAGFGLALLPSCKGRRSARSDAAPSLAAVPATDELDLVLDVNGKQRELRIDPRVSLLDALRERLGLTGTKKGCDHGQCGACTVHVDGRAVLSCMTLAITAPGRKVITIEGLAQGEQLHPLQQAFLDHDGFQCGYCTPGQIMHGAALLAEGRAVTDEQVKTDMSGNLCRCGAYPNIVAAIQSARRT